MAQDEKTKLRLEIAHVLFIDVVGYSQLSINEQHAAVDELTQVVRGTGEFKKADASQRLIKIATGDGVALVFYSTPEAPVRCAIEVSRALKENPRLRLRMGIHSGPVSGVIDVTERTNLAGAGLNLAQRVMNCGDTGHILLSKHVAEDLAEFEEWRPLLHDLGTCEVKHGTEVSIANLYGSDFGNPELPATFRLIKKRSGRRRNLIIGAALIAGAAIIAVGVWFWRARMGSSLSAPEKTIAVLPFENLSRDPENAYFAEGMQDEILARLSKIADLKVISRTSTEKYKSAPDNLREIAKQLGVANIVEGSVQKAADQVRVDVQLINALNETHLWGDIYDRKLTDIFTVENDIATTIAETLQAKLTGSRGGKRRQDLILNPFAGFNASYQHEHPHMIHDFRFAFRQLIKAPGFTFAAMLVLALGIGANTAVFSLVNTLFFAPPAYSKPHELVQVFSEDRKDPKKFRGFSYPTYRDIREQNTVFSDVMAFNLALIGLGQKGDTRRAFAAIVSSNYFSVLGVPLARGRAFLPEEETRNAPVAIASYSYWQKHNLDPTVLGSEVLINGRAFTIVGITPKGFTGTLQILSPEVWLPLSVYDQVANDFGSKDKTTMDDRNRTQLRIIGRLKPGMTMAAAKPALEGLAANLEKAYPVEQKNQKYITAPLSRISVSTNPAAGRGVKSIAPLLLGMAVVVLLVACLNLANMLLARGTARRKEIAIRLALGGRRWRIVRQLLSEGFVLALLGGVGGLILGLWSSDLLIGSMRRLMPFEIVWLTGANAILAATFGFCMLGTLMFALGPALKISRTAVITDLKENAGEDVIQRRWKFLPRNPLVVVQIAFSLALLTAAALFVRGAGKAAAVDSGLKPGASYLLEVDASLAGYEPKRAQELYQNLNARLAALPGVEKVSISATVPFGMISSDKNVQRAGVNSGADAKPATAAEGLAFKAAWNSVGANYFSTVGLPVLRGRAFTEAETTQPGLSVAIIDEPLAKKLWPDGDAIGQRVQYANEKEQQNQTIEIVGIVPVTRHDLFASEEPDGSIYVPFARGFQSNVSFFVRFRSLAPGSEAATADLLRRAVREVDPLLPIISLQTFAHYLDSNLDLWLVRAGAAMFSVFGGLALGLAVVGLYGVKVYSVARRTREIGIRMALGAQRGMVLRLIMREGSIMLLCGLALGLLLAAATGKILSGILFEVGAFDPPAFASAFIILAAATLIATWLPARRATHINPMVALRTE